MWNNCQIMILYIYKNSVYIRFEYVQFIFCIQLFNKNSFVSRDCDLSDCDIEIIYMYYPLITLIYSHSFTRVYKNLILHSKKYS